MTLQLYNLRPDLLANLCNLSAFFLILRRRKMIAYGLAGLLLGFSISLSPKYGPYLFLMPILMVVHHENLSFYFRALLAHAAGIGIGLLPLFIWLSAHNLMAPFYQWVVAFNTNRILDGTAVFGGKFQLLPTGFGVWGCFLLLKSKNEEARYHGRLLCILMGLSALVYLKPSRLHHEFYEQMYILAGILAASGPFLFLLKKWSDARRTVPAFLLSGFVLWSSVHAAQKGLRHGSFTRGKELIQTLKRAAGTGEVVCIVPDHPITSRNAVYIGTGWQYYTWLSHPAFREKLQNLVRDIQIADPAVIFNKNNQPYFRLRPDIFTHLQNAGILSANEADGLRKTINARYRLVVIQEREFWVRNDRAAACF